MLPSSPAATLVCFGHVLFPMKLAALGLPPKLIGSAAAEINVGQTVVIKITPQHCIHISHFRQRMLDIDEEFSTAIQKHGVAHFAQLGRPAREQ